MLVETQCASCFAWSEAPICLTCALSKGDHPPKRMIQTASEVTAQTTYSVPTASEPEVKCARCGSSQLSANGKGFGVGKAAVGAILLGPVGLAAGAIGSSKVVVTCLKCGNRWKPGR